MKINYYEKIYRNSKALCKKNGEQMGDLETLIGLSKGYLSRIPKKGIAFAYVKKIADHFDVTIDELSDTDFFHKVPDRDADDIIDRIYKALEDTEYEVVFSNNSDIWLEVYIDRRLGCTDETTQTADG